MTTTLVKGRYVICGIEDGGGVRQVDDGAVLVRDGRIAAVGPAAALAREAAGAETIGGDDFVVIPGLVNAHHHVGLTPLQLGTPDLPLELWVNHRMGARKVDLHLDTLYSAFELLRSGVTTVQHLHIRVPGGVAEVCAGARQVIRAYRDLGMRVSYSYGLRDQNRIVYQDDAAFLATLPDDLAREVSGYVQALALSAEENLEVYSRLAEEFVAAPDVAVQLAPLNFQWCSDAALEKVAEVSHGGEVPIHMHLLETPYQRAYARKRTGGSVVDHLDAMGLLNDRMTLGHGVWTTEADLDLIAERDTRVCHNCSSNLRIRSGIAPVTAMLARGIKVALGIDEAGVNDDRDMLQEMRQVLHLHRAPGIERRVPTTAEVFRMASEHGALTTGFGERIGRIDVGRAADLVLVKWSQIAYPFLDPDLPVIDAVVHRAKSRGVDTVLIAGDAVLRDGRVTRVDEDAVLGELAAMLSRPPSDDEVKRRQAARRLMPYIETFYQGYLADEPFEPYDHRHSRR